MSERVSVPRVRLANGLEVCRIINGMWQVSGTHGPVYPDRAAAEMVNYYDAGLTSFDMADIYGPAESIYGKHRYKLALERGQGALCGIQGLTKWCPRPGGVTRKIAEGAMATSMQKMGVNRLDCVQYHCWDYSERNYLDALGHLAHFQALDTVGEVSLTNFDTCRLQEIVERGFHISSNQVQFSLIDMRPAARMAPFCLANNIKLLTYGTLGGGLISERYLDRPEPRGRDQLNTASLSKYKNMIDQWGGWTLFQELLHTLSSIGQSHRVSISNVATRYILDQPAVGSVIIGCRLGAPNANHVQDTLNTFSFELTQGDHSRIEAVLRKSRDLIQVIGDCGGEYR